MGVKAAKVGRTVPAVEKSEEEKMNVKKYLRGEAADLGELKDKKLRGQLAVREELYGKSTQAAAQAEKWLMPSEGGYLEVEGIEKTWRIKQEAIAAEVDISSSRKQFDIVLPDFGLYTLDFSLSGRYMIAAGKKGHMALLDMKNMDLIKEFQCDGAGHVISLQLDGEAISDGIENSSTLFRLEYLEKLNLAYNEFNYTEIPRGIHNLTHLTHLNLSRADFGGQLPVELSFLRKLVSLDLSYFNGIIDRPNLEMFLRNLTGLTEMYLDGVDISSQKSEWSFIISSYLPNLRNLSLRYCGLYGPLDTYLLQLHSLSLLRLDGNYLSTPVPDFFANFSSLTTLSFYNCSLKDYFPMMIFQIPSLQNLDLSENQLLSGTIPPFAHGGSLKSLVLSKTNFSGSLPNSIGTLRNLSQIDLSSCKFTGPIPSTFGNLTQLIYVDFSNNSFSGTLSSSLFGGLNNLISLNLGFNSFTGNIPRSLFGLPSLRRLWLNRNQFIGQVEEFPIVNASNIVYLELSSNQLEGPIPNSLLQLQSLAYLSLSHNSFSGTLQLEKIHLPNLVTLDLSFNNLSVRGNVNSSSSRFPKLNNLNLASCDLYEFPEFINNSMIAQLDLSNNRIAGEIPSWIWGISNEALYTLNLSSNLLTGMQKPYHIPRTLAILDLHSNQLRGELHLPFSMQDPIHVLLPSPNTGTFFTSSTIYFLSLANNSLTGSIPTSLCNATNLGLLDLSLNQLSGNIPPCLLANKENLEVFNLGGNNLSGHIPDNIPLRCRLQNFDLNNNNLEGNFPKSIQNCYWLDFMNVGNNIINDSFPCMLPSFLRVIVLTSNRFHGQLRCHKSWPNLQIVDISSNNFSGSLEAVNFSSWGAMMLESDAYIRTVSNFLKPTSRIYYPIGVTVTLNGLKLNLVKIWRDNTVVDFSSNNFLGVIPSAIGDLRYLRYLNLSHNAINGSIPKSFGKLGVIGSLDLSVNQLTGTIPLELAGLTTLSTLNLSYNKLVGNIPKGSQFQTFTVDSFKGNPGLCLNVSCSTTDGNGSSPPQYEKVESKKEIEWEYVWAAVGFVVGLGSIAWILLCCRSFRERYFDKVEDVVEKRLYGISRRRRRARRLVRTQGRR